MPANDPTQQKAGQRRSTDGSVNGRRGEDGAWLGVLRRYLLFVAGANLLWETAQLPLYTIWREGSSREKAVAIVHCTGGDVLIAVTALVLALVVTGSGWPLSVVARRRVGAMALIIGVGYTVFSEWLNVAVRATWAYSDLMPVVPLLGLGLSPLAQWIAIPITGFWWSTRGMMSATNAPPTGA
jgi:hypothetical protein